MMKRSNATLPIPPVVQDFLNELDAERKVKVREKARQLREWDDEFFKSLRTTSAPTEKSVEPVEPAESKATTSSLVEPSEVPASTESEVIIDNVHNQTNQKKEPEYNYVQKNVDNSDTTPASFELKVKHEIVNNQNPKSLEPQYNFVTNKKNDLETKIDNVPNSIEASWFSDENLKSMAADLTQCPDKETLDALRECWPVEPMKAASRLLSPEDSQRIKGWVVESNELAQKRKLWELEAPVILPISELGDRTATFKPIALESVAQALAACSSSDELKALRETYPQEILNDAWVALPNWEIQKRIDDWMAESQPGKSAPRCVLIKSPFGLKWFQIDVQPAPATASQGKKEAEPEAPIATDLGYGIATDSTQNHTLRESEPILTHLGYTLLRESDSNHTLREPEPLPIEPNGSHGVVRCAYQLVTDAQSLAESLKPLAAAPVISIDTETTGLEPHTDKIRLVQLAVPDQPVVIVDLAAIAFDALDPLRQLLTGPAIKVFHNGKFDWKFLGKAGLKPTGPYFDTMLASQLLKAGLPSSHSLKAIAAEYLRIELEKDQQTSDWNGEISSAQLEYAARDAAILLQLREVMKPKLIEAGLVEAAKLEFEAMPAVAEMELCGMLLDLSKWEALGREMEQAKVKAKAELAQQLRSGNPQMSLMAEFDTVDPDSPSQVLTALKAMGIPVESTGKNALIPLADKYPVIQALLKYRRFAKAVSAFTDKFPAHINPLTGRIHPDYNQYGAATGRFSASNPNLQQVPRGKEVRSCFIPTPGYKLVIADYSQIELRVAAEISGDRTMIEAYQKGEDLHKLTASLITGKPLDEISKAERQAGKPVNFGLIYGCGAKKLGQTAENDYGVVKPLKEWEAYRTQFFKAYRGIASWHTRLLREKPIEIRTLSNRRRQWTEQPWVTATSNSMVQGTAADITKIALAMLPDALASTGAKLIGTVHDEILLECPEATANVAARILQDCMVRAGETYLKLVPVEVEAKVADSWADK